MTRSDGRKVPGSGQARRLAGRVLAVDPDPVFLGRVTGVLDGHGYECVGVRSGAEAVEAVRRASWDVVVVALGLPDLSGIEVLAQAFEQDPSCEVVVAGGCDEVGPAVAAFRAGAQSYLIKPAGDEQMLLVVDQARRRRSLRRKATLASLRGAGARRALGASPAWQRAMAAIRAAAQAPLTEVLITGEAGTGKGLGASLLHAWSDRAAEPFVSFNPAALAEDAVEGEIFGRDGRPRGERRGLLELADGGTLFLDEVGELPHDLQPKLLRALDGQPFRRVGGGPEIHVDVRFVSATSRELGPAVAAGRFRPDLYHRLRVVEIALPPLRERGDDVELLARHFVSCLGAELGKPGVGLTPAALAALRAYQFPGNVRELRNVIERAVLLCRGRDVDLDDLPPEVRRSPAVPGGEPPVAPLLGPGAPAGLDGGHPHNPGASEITTPHATDATEVRLVRLEDVIRRHVTEVFRASRANVTRTAQALGISRVALRRRLREYGIKPQP
jgi:DNA-binding NtrC family response regulator